MANKADLLGGRAAPLPDGAMLACGLSPEAGALLRTRLSALLADDVATESASEVLGNLRQADLVVRARAATAETLAALDSGVSPEYAATHCHAALDALADLVGETTSEDVLTSLFAAFCVGK